MSRRSRALSCVAVVVLGGACGSTRPPPAPLENRADPLVGTPPPSAPAPSCDAPVGTSHPIEIDQDPTTREVAVEDYCGSFVSCSYRIYAERDACWRSLGEVGEMMEEPGCAPKRDAPVAKGTYCTLSGMRLMIHGEGYEYEYPYANGYGTEEATGYHTDPPPP